jgi:nucleotide-binding universal stress UspA family protein
MNWKDILVFADGSQNGLARTQMAADLAVAAGATLEICVPICIPAFLASGGVDFAVDLHDELERGAREDAGRAAIEIRSRLPQLAGQLEVHTPEVRAQDVPKLAGVLGQTCDLIVLGQPIAEDATRVDDALLDGALFQSGRPCLVFPRWDAPQVWGKRILIAWKDTREAASAVHHAMPLLAEADAVYIVTVQHGSHIDRSLERSTERLVRHLGRFGIKTESRAVLSDGPDGPELLDQAKRWSADLLVMGAYGHSQFRERIIGGVTRTAIRHSPIALLLSH